VRARGPADRERTRVVRSRPPSSGSGWITSILLYYHRPDGVTPVAETLGAMQELLEEGKVGALGVSNVDAGQLAEAAAAAPVAAVQNHYSLLTRGDDAEVLPLCRERGIGFVPYFPLESGLLTGKYRRGAPAPQGARLAGDDDGRLSDERLARVEALETFAAERERSLLELAIGGLASIPGISTVIAGATSVEQVQTNAEAGAWILTGDELEALEQL